MADLNIIAEQTVELLEELENEANQVEEQVGRTEQATTEAENTLNQAWSGLENRVQILLEQVISAQEILIGERSSLDEAIAQLKTKLEITRTQLEEAAQNTKDSLANISEQSDELMLALDSAHESSVLAYENLRARTEDIEAQMADGLQGTQDYLLNQLDDDIISYEAELEQQVDEMTACIQDMCLPNIAAKVEDFIDHVDTITDQVTSYLEDLQEGMEQSVAGALDVFQSSHEEHLSDLLGTAGEVSSFLTDLGESVIEQVSSIQDTMGLLGEAVSTTNTGAEAAIGTLEDVIDLLTLDF